MRKAKRTFINTPKANRVVGRYDFSHMGFALLHEEKILYALECTDEAIRNGLIVDHHDKYGWTITSPSDELLEVILKYDLTDILLNRNEFSGFQITGTGTHSGTSFVGVSPKKSSSRNPLSWSG